jgi:hypothetical protein
MMVVDVTTRADGLFFTSCLFEQRYAFGGAQSISNYDVSPDGPQGPRAAEVIAN